MSSLASVCASSLSVLAFACEIDLSRRVLATITRIPRACSTEVTFSAPLVASSATRSLATKLSANSSSAGTRVGTLPADLTSLPSAIATSQKSRCTSKPNPRTSSPFVGIRGRAAGHTTKTDSCSQHTREGRRGGHEQRRARSSSVRSACPTASPNNAPCPGSTMLTAGADGSFIPGQRLGISLDRARGRLPSSGDTPHTHTRLPTSDQWQG